VLRWNVLSQGAWSVWLFPYARFTVETPLSRDEIRQRLDQTVDEHAKFFEWLSGTARPYRGHLGIDSFKIWRRIRYRNSFLPVVLGQIHEGVHQRSVEITMRLRLLVAVFMVFWLSAVASFGLATQRPAAIGMFLFGYTLMTVCFSYEAARTKKSLHRLLGPGPWDRTNG
jgi:hypothetical protein